MAGAGLGPEDLGGDPAWQKIKRGNMRAREGRSWRDSLFSRGKTVTNHLGLLRLRETSQTRTLRFKNGMVGHLRHSLGKGTTELPSSTLLPTLLNAFFLLFCSPTVCIPQY